MQQQPLRAIVVGGGIGGLAAAIALRQAGVDATVYERAAELREVGAGLAIWRNAVNALGRLGLAETVEAHAVPDLGGGIRSWRGDMLVDLGKSNRSSSGPALSIIIHRATLLEILRGALGEPNFALLHGKATVVTVDDDATVAAMRLVAPSSPFLSSRRSRR